MKYQCRHVKSMQKTAYNATNDGNVQRYISSGELQKEESFCWFLFLFKMLLTLTMVKLAGETITLDTDYLNIRMHQIGTPTDS